MREMYYTVPDNVSSAIISTYNESISHRGPELDELPYSLSRNTDLVVGERHLTALNHVGSCVLIPFISPLTNSKFRL